MLPSGLLTRPKIALIIGVHTVRDGFESASFAVALEHAEKLIFTVKTAHRIIALVGRIFQLARLYRFNWNFMFARKRERVGEMSSGQTSGIGNHRTHLVAEHL